MGIVSIILFVCLSDLIRLLECFVNVICLLEWLFFFVIYVCILVCVKWGKVRLVIFKVVIDVWLFVVSLFK